MEVLAELERAIPTPLVDLEELDRYVQALRVSVATGEISLPFAVSGIESILDGTLATREFPVWMSFDALPHLQTCVAFHQFERAVKTSEKQLSFNRWLLTESMWEHQLDVYGPIPSHGSVVRVRPIDLGFKGYRKLNLARVYERALELGLQLCPPKIAYHLRLAYLDQPVGEWLLVATPPIRDYELRYIQLLLGRGPNQGVYVGINDTGIEVFHLAWRNRDLNTKILPDQEIVFMKS